MQNKILGNIVKRAWCAMEGNQMPGPGAKGMGDTAIRNFDKWQEIRVQMDTISEHEEVDTSFVLWGQRFRYPFFAGPVGAVNLHYGEKYNDQSYNDVMVAACAEAGIAAMTGDGVNPDVMKYATDAIRRVDSDDQAVEYRDHS